MKLPNIYKYHSVGLTCFGTLFTPAGLYGLYHSYINKNISLAIGSLLWISMGTTSIYLGRKYMHLANRHSKESERLDNAIEDLKSRAKSLEGTIENAERTNVSNHDL